MLRAIVNALLAGTVAKLVGNLNFAEGMFDVEGMMPIGKGLHDPDVTCLPFVRGRLGTVAQKLIKLFPDVREATWPGSAWDWPSFRKPFAMTLGRRVNDFCGSRLSDDCADMVL